MLKVAFRSSADAQLVAAKGWYDQQRKGLGDEFARSLESVINRVARNPFAAPVVYANVRRFYSNAFSYSVFYTTDANNLLVLSCLDTRRATFDGSAS